MPPENLRSIAYRSFVTCDDPKGVVNCGIRRHKSSKKLEEKLEQPKMLKKVNSTSRYEEKKEVVSKGGMEESHRSSSFQLMEVSRGAQKLNQVIDSWSRRASFDGGSKDYAKDLLLGALDLQDSLAMLGELQEASQYRTNLKKKEKEKPCVSKVDEVGIARTSSDRYGNPKYQNPRPSGDGSSRDCYDELREVIRDSLARQNLLPTQSSRESARQNLSTPQSFRENAYFDRRKMNSYGDIPSTSSSSISSMTYSHDFASSVSTSSSKIPEGKPRTSNLVAKLMGLEDISSKPLQPASQKHHQRESVLSQTPIFDVDMNKERKPQFVGQKMDRGCMTLEEIIDNMQFQGLLKRNQHQAYHQNTSFKERRVSYDASPIVLIKPTYPGVEAKKHSPHRFIPDEAALNSEIKQRFWKTEEEITSKIKEYPRRPSNSNESRRKLHSGDSVVKKLSPEKGAKTSRNLLAKPRDVEVISEKKVSSNKMNASVPISPSPPKEIVEKKIDKIRKATSKKKLPEIEDLISKSVPESHGHDSVPTTKLRKSETGSSNLSKNSVTQRKGSGLNSPIKHTKSTSSCGDSVQKRTVKNSKPVKEPVTANRSIPVPSIVHNDDNNMAHIKEKLSSKMVDSEPDVQLVLEEEMDDSEIPKKENCDSNLDKFCEDSAHPTTLLCEDSAHPTLLENGTDSAHPTQLINGTIRHDEAPEQSKHDSKESDVFQPETTTATPETLQLVEEPSENFDASQQIVSSTLTGVYDSAPLDSKLLVDYASELLEIKNHKLLMNPLLNLANDSRLCMSNNNLLEEARIGMENLRSYGQPGLNSAPASDIVSSVLERDLRCKGVAADGPWNLGWREGFTNNQVEQIVSDLEKLVFRELIDEVLADSVV
ncbi:hypothetical protein ACET3Z_012258 [Daucus carota]